NLCLRLTKSGLLPVSPGPTSSPPVFVTAAASASAATTATKARSQLTSLPFAPTSTLPNETVATPRT
ncbi:hypothetical protein ALC57_11501, partial [Trachymyrmex cornetzi]